MSKFRPRMFADVTDAHARLIDIMQQTGIEKDELAQLLGIQPANFRKWVPAPDKPKQEIPPVRERQILDIIEVDAVQGDRTVDVGADEICIIMPRYQRR